MHGKIQTEKGGTHKLPWKIIKRGKKTSKGHLPKKPTQDCRRKPLTLGPLRDERTFKESGRGGNLKFSRPKPRPRGGKKKGGERPEEGTTTDTMPKGVVERPRKARRKVEKKEKSPLKEKISSSRDFYPRRGRKKGPYKGEKKVKDQVYETTSPKMGA